MEIIVVDNGSSDGSPEAVRQDFPEVALIETGKNLGFAKGNNVGIRKSQGKHVCLANSDTIVNPNALRRLVDFLDSHDKVGMVAPRILNPDGTIQPSCRNFPTLGGAVSRALALDRLFPHSEALSGSFLPVSAHGHQRDVDVASGCFCVARREALEQVGLLDEDFFMYSEDLDWCRRFRQMGWGIVFHPKAQVVHYGGGSSSNAPTRFSLEQQRADFLYWKKHRGMVVAGIYRVIVFLHLNLRLIGRILCLALGRGTARHSHQKIREHVACLKDLFFT